MIASASTLSSGEAALRDSHYSIRLNLSLKGAPQYLSQKIQSGLGQGYRIFKLRIDPIDAPCYPNICVPLAGIIDYYRQEYGCRFMDSASWRSSTYLEHAGILCPNEYDQNDLPGSFLDRVWKFTPDTHYLIVQRIMESARRACAMQKDVLSALELALNEVSDNTLQHYSSAPDNGLPTGYVMVQYHKSNQSIAVAVFDAGQGIPSSLSHGKWASASPEEALKLALEAGVTDGNGAGNGLWIMDRLVSATAGSFEVTSDGFRYSSRHVSGSDVARRTSSTVSRIKKGTTLVDFQLRTDLPIDIREVLGGQDHVNIWVEDHFDDDMASVRMSVKDESRGQASRYEGRAFSNEVCNLLAQVQGVCILDFEGIEIVSASYADELIGGLLEYCGFVGFLKRVRLVGLSYNSAAVIDRCFRNRFFGIAR